ncbi:GLPGLI family protein [Siansivirga zeaxanthinifaciens]|uniref:GLPGLI family protein n=1 Tax=Siansivirga zeaxanthinifaciens CC-SAMT-1 TaxID=1454006 RepID=A0A0C5WCA1_9FLAO|nr:GLPGLI family protein [Siansivirga zeaxanthinifaciens]AJR02974.1 hypothetical protein AW14_04320 [Siansivirga zeaxanthinifaciens CC-SAMT-1]
MKKNLLLKILFLVSCELCFSQDIKSIKVTYGKYMKSLLDTTKTNPKQLKDLFYVLDANLNESRFEFVKRLDIDNYSNKRLIGRSGGDGVYYKNLNLKEKLHQKYFGDKEFLISYDFNRYNWKISKETKIIGNYKCYKASTSYSFYSKLADNNFEVNIIAWFTPEISIPFGPAGYDGLPGLVLEVQIGGFYFVASKIQINTKVEIKKPKSGIKVTSKEYDKIIETSFDGKLD